MYNELFIRGFNNFDHDENSRSTSLVCEEKSRTIQSEAKDTDINEIVRRFGVTGMLPNRLEPILEGDFDAVFDYQSAQNLIIAADRAFMQMPAEVRSRFSNDAGLFVDFCSNPENIDEMVKLGLAIPKALEDARPVVDGPA